jgi:hypothetical protein
MSYSVENLPMTLYMLTRQPLGIALVVFSQTLGGAIFLAFAQTIFSHSLVTGLAEYAPTVSVRIQRSIFS